MSDQDTIFGGNPAPQQTQDPANPAPAPVENPWADKLRGITNETGEPKYRDVDTALDALQASQRYIPELHSKLDQKESELAALRAELAKTQGYIEATQQFQTSPEPQGTPTPAGLDAEQATELFKQVLSADRQEQARAQNINAVTSALQEKFGDKAADVFYAKAEELGLSREAINSLAGTSPAAVLAYFGTKSDKTSVDVSAKTSVYMDPAQEPHEVTLGRRTGKSVLSGSTSRDVRAEFEYNKELVAKIHAEGGTVEDLSDPRSYYKYFGK